jgi:hypothetical protein
MKSFQRLLPWFAMALTAGLVWMFWLQDRKGDLHGKLGPVANPWSQRGMTAERRAEGSSPHASVLVATEITRLIELGGERFGVSSGAEESAGILQELRDQLRLADSQQAVAAIVDFLKSGKDAPTHLPFVVGSEGVMESVPTLRTALLDVLPSLDPSAALDVARSVMDEKKSPDEFALALRNLAWNDLGGDLENELSERFDQMIQMEDWVEDPTSGFLEALDAGVSLSDKRSFDSMVRLNRQALASGNQPLARALFVALDRMVLRAPSLLAGSFSEDPELTGLSSGQRASLLSRLDITDSMQRDVFVRYLAAPTHAVAELDYFADIFPNGNYLHGNWLVTSGEAAQSIGGRLQSDRAVLAEIDRLIVNSANERMNEALVRIRGRLQKITKE